MDARFISSRPELKPNELSRLGKTATTHTKGKRSPTSVVTCGHNTDLHGVSPFAPTVLQWRALTSTNPLPMKLGNFAIHSGISLVNWWSPVNQGVLSTLKYREINFSLIMCVYPVPCWIAQWPVFSAPFGLEAVWWGHVKSGIYSISSGFFYVCPRGDCIQKPLCFLPTCGRVVTEFLAVHVQGTEFLIQTCLSFFIGFMINIWQHISPAKMFANFGFYVYVRPRMPLYFSDRHSISSTGYKKII